ncbi:hypothetical protein QCA50_009178 [Cerrena zonata]|uniref:Uncharacterized protein n=1 Tax=Cerrena zonata TaxID=2478898 RepID=A0AAW0G8N2_9APHY
MSTAYQPSHPGLFTVQFGEGDFSAYLKSNKAFKVGETVARIEGTTNGVTKAYTSVQYGVKEHLELNSDLRYGCQTDPNDAANHSCEPNTAWDLSSPNPEEWHIRALKKIEVGESSEYQVLNRAVKNKSNVRPSYVLLSQYGMGHGPTF